MSYKDFSDLNDALAASSLSPLVETTRRLFNSVETMTSMAKDLPSSWGRSYSGVMVLKYDRDGNPTDVTESGFPHAVDVPNSLISDVQRRFRTEKANYDQICAEVNEGITVDTNIPASTIADQWLKSATNDQILASLQIAPNLYFIIGYVSNALKYKFTTSPEVVDPLILGSIVKIPNGQQNSFTIHLEFRRGSTLIQLTGWIGIDNVNNDTVYITTGSQLTRVNGDNSWLGSHTLPSQIATNLDTWNNFSTSGLTAANSVLNTVSKTIPSCIRSGVTVNYSDIITLNSTAITDLNSAIEAL